MMKQDPKTVIIKSNEIHNSTQIQTDFIFRTQTICLSNLLTS